MNNIKVWHWILSICLLSTLVILFFSTNTLGVARDSLDSSNSIAGAIVVPAAAFHSDGVDPDSAFFSFPDGYLTGRVSAYGCVVAPIHLPHGATITGFRANVFDNDISLNLGINLNRINLDTGINMNVASIYTDSTSLDIQKPNANLTESLVYASNAYYLTTCLMSPDLRLYSVIINYGHSTYLPLIQR